MECVVVERDLPFKADRAMLTEIAANTCFDLYGVEPIRSYLAADGRRLVCVFQAPDAEAVRTTLRDAVVPPKRVWASTVHTP